MSNDRMSDVHFKCREFARELVAEVKRLRENERLVELAIAAEREACAKVAEYLAEVYTYEDELGGTSMAREIAEKIRARGGA